MCFILQVTNEASRYSHIHQAQMSTELGAMSSDQKTSELQKQQLKTSPSLADEQQQQHTHPKNENIDHAIEFEPDWKRFQRVYARGELMLAAYQVPVVICHHSG